MATKLQHRRPRTVESTGALRLSASDWDVGYILPEGSTSIGAGPKCDLRLDGQGLKPLHCVVERTDAGATVRRWSPNTKLNGSTFTVSDLRIGDRLLIGSLELLVSSAEHDIQGERTDSPEELADELAAVLAAEADESAHDQADQSEEHVHAEADAERPFPATEAAPNASAEPAGVDLSAGAPCEFETAIAAGDSDSAQGVDAAVSAESDAAGRDHDAPQPDEAPTRDEPPVAATSLAVLAPIPPHLLKPWLEANPPAGTVPAPDAEHAVADPAAIEASDDSDTNPLAAAEAEPKQSASDACDLAPPDADGEPSDGAVEYYTDVNWSAVDLAADDRKAGESTGVAIPQSPSPESADREGHDARERLAASRARVRRVVRTLRRERGVSRESRQELTALSERCELLAAELETVSAALSEREAQINTLERERETRCQELASLRETLAEQEVLGSELREQLSAQATQIEALCAAMQEWEHERVRLADELESAKQAASTPAPGAPLNDTPTVAWTRKDSAEPVAAAADAVDEQWVGVAPAGDGALGDGEPADTQWTESPNATIARGSLGWVTPEAAPEATAPDAPDDLAALANTPNAVPGADEHAEADPVTTDPRFATDSWALPRNVADEQHPHEAAPGSEHAEQPSSGHPFGAMGLEEQHTATNERYDTGAPNSAEPADAGFWDHANPPAAEPSVEDGLPLAGAHDPDTTLWDIERSAPSRLPEHTVGANDRRDARFGESGSDAEEPAAFDESPEHITDSYSEAPLSSEPPPAAEKAPSGAVGPTTLQREPAEHATETPATTEARSHVDDLWSAPAAADEGPHTDAARRRREYDPDAQVAVVRPEAGPTPIPDWLMDGSDNDEELDEPTDTPFAPSNPTATTEEVEPSFQPPKSFLEQYAHVLPDDDEPAAAPGASIGVAEPVSPLAPAAASEPAAGVEDEEDIDAYMAQLMKRMRGAEPEPQAPSPRTRGAAKPPVESPTGTPMPKPAPLLSLDEIRKSVQPEQGTDMSSLRDLANQSARHAIGVAASKESREQSLANLFIALIAMGSGGYLVTSAPQVFSTQLFGGAFALLLAGVWVFRSVSHLLRSMATDGQSRGRLETFTREKLPIQK